MIGVRPSVANRPHRILLENPGEPTHDGAGGYTEGWTALDPPNLFVSIQAVTDREQVAAGTVITSATRLISGPFHPGVTTETRLTFVDIGGRTHFYNVLVVGNREQRDADMVLTCEERVQ